MKPQVRELRTRREREVLLAFPWKLYRNDPLWIPPLLPELRSRIDPRKGKFFKRGEAAFFAAYRDSECVGTIMAGWDKPTMEHKGSRDAIFGFFEYVDLETAEALVGRASEWARERGRTALFGPFNLDYEDSYGVLIEGRDRKPTLLCGHSMPYYPDTMEKLGFVAARGDNIALELRLDPPHPELERMAALSPRICSRYGFSIREADFSEIDREIDAVHMLLNTALRHLPDFIEQERDAVVQMIEPFRRLADPRLILFAEKDGKPIGWLPGVPNLNEALATLGGLKYPWQLLRAPFALKRKYECLTIKSALILPEYWGTGLAAVLIGEMYARIKDSHYKWVDLSLTSVDNPFAPKLAERFGAKIYKRYRVYRKGL